MKKYIYFVSFQLQDRNKVGFGNMEIISNKKYDCYENILETEAVIKATHIERHNATNDFNAVILNFILLRTEKSGVDK